MRSIIRSIISQMTKRNFSSRIEANPEIAFGKPVVKETRISVEFVLGLLEAGWKVDEILKEYPTLTQKDILACISYARKLVGEWKIYPLLFKNNHSKRFISSGIR